MSEAAVSSSPAAGTTALTARTAATLAGVARRHLHVRLGEFPTRLGMILPLLWLAQAAGDRLLRFAWSTRLELLLFDAAVALVLFYRHVFVPYRERLDRHAAARLIERRLPQFRSALISACELTAKPCAQPVLLQVLVGQVDQLVAGRDVPAEVIRTVGLKKRLRQALLALGLLVGAAGVFYPGSFVLARRVFLSTAALPTHTTVRPLTRDAVVPIGSDFEASAHAEGIVPREGRLVVHYEDGRRETVSVTAAASKPDLFSFSLKNARQPFTYHFELNDGSGDEYRVSVRALLALSEVHFTQTYPAYTALPRTEMASGNLALLAGGKLSIQGQSSAALKSASLVLEGTGQSVPMQITGQDKRTVSHELPIPREGLTGLTIHLESTTGEPSEHDPTYRVEILTDKPPVVTLQTPREDKTTVVVNAKVPVAFLARDDFGIKKLELVYQVFRVDGEGIALPAEKGTVPLDGIVPDAGGVRGFLWDLATLVRPLAVDCSMVFSIEATDNDAMSGPNVGHSKPRTIVVVSEAAKRAELINALDKKAAEIERLYHQQRTINQKTDAALRRQP